MLRCRAKDNVTGGMRKTIGSIWFATTPTASKKSAVRDVVGNMARVEIRA